MEVPSSSLFQGNVDTDLDFVLAHQVLEDKDYCHYYRYREPGRELILDNSMHELGAPLGWAALLEAAKKVKADYVVSPDKLDDAGWTYEKLTEAGRILKPSGFKIAANLVGDTAAVRRCVSRKISETADMLCLPYRRPRLQWFLSYSPLQTWFPRIHLLGMSTLEELACWASVSRYLPSVRFTTDTSKPVKWAIAGRRIDDGKDLRHAPTSSKDLLNHPSLSEESLRILSYNVRYLRRVLAGHEQLFA